MLFVESRCFCSTNQSSKESLAMLTIFLVSSWKKNYSIFKNLFISPVSCHLEDRISICSPDCLCVDQAGLKLPPSVGIKDVHNRAQPTCLFCLYTFVCASVVHSVTALIPNTTVDFVLIFWLGAGKMTQRVKAFVAKSNDLSLVSGTHVVEGENQLLRLPSDLYMCHGIHVPCPK